MLLTATPQANPMAIMSAAKNLTHHNGLLYWAIMIGRVAQHY